MYAAAAETNLITDAGLRGEFAFDSKTTSPVFSSTTMTEGSASVDVVANCEKARVIATESAATAELCGAAKKPARRQATTDLLERIGKLNADSDNDVENCQSEH